MYFSILVCMFYLGYGTLIASDNDVSNVSFVRQSLIGASAGLATTTIVEPLIYVKNSWQQQKPLARSPRVFYRGLFVNGAGFVPTMAIQAGCYAQTSKMLKDTTIPETAHGVSAAAVAGIASAFPSTIRELLIIQQQNHGSNFYQVARNIAGEYGYQVFLRGFVPIAIRNSSFATFFFVATPHIREEVEQYTSNPLFIKLGPSTIAGLMSAAITHPVDTIKTTMQAQLHEKRSIADTMKYIYYAQSSSSQGALKNFCRGLTPRMLAVAGTMSLEYNFREFFAQLF